MDAHSNEFAAAVAGMAETYGTPQLAPGTGVAFRLEGWSPASYADGIVRGYTSDGMLSVNSDVGALVLDPRPWPDGNLLPF